MLSMLCRCRSSVKWQLLVVLLTHLKITSWSALKETWHPHRHLLGPFVGVSLFSPLMRFIAQMHLVHPFTSRLFYGVPPASNSEPIEFTDPSITNVRKGLRIVRGACCICIVSWYLQCKSRCKTRCTCGRSKKDN